MAYSNYFRDFNGPEYTVVTGTPYKLGTKASTNTAFTTYRTDWQRAAERRLVQIIRLRHGWDGYQGLPIDPTIAEYTYRFLEVILLRPGVPLPTITPVSYGGIILEWHRNGWDVEIEIDAPASHNVHTLEIASGAEIDFRLGFRMDRLADIIAKISD